MKRAVFMDRDGTLNQMVYDETHGLIDSPRRPDQVTAVPGAGHFIQAVRDLGYLVIVVSNQPGISKGTLTLPELEAVNERLLEELARDGGGWDDLYYAAYHPQGGPGASPDFRADFRKPAPGMLIAAAKQHGVDLAQSWMIGDGIVDVQAGCAAGCRTILLSQIKMEQVERFVNMENAEPDHVVRDYAEALKIIRGAG